MSSEIISRVSCPLYDVLCGLFRTYNFGGKLNNRLLSAFQRKDMEAAKLEQRRSQALIRLLIKYGKMILIYI